MSEERFNQLETKLDGVVTDVAGLTVTQTPPGERLARVMEMVRLDLVARLDEVIEAQRDVPRQFEQINRKLDVLAAEVKSLKDSETFFARVLNHHEFRITTLEAPQTPR